MGLDEAVNGPDDEGGFVRLMERERQEANVEMAEG